MAAAWLSFIGVLFYLHLHILSLQALDLFPCPKFSKLNLPPGVVSPDSPFLDGHGKGPYVGVADGRILRYNDGCFEDFATISPDRTKEECDGISGTNVTLRRRCGRAMGFAYHPKTEDLYVVGAFGGLSVVCADGQTTSLATKANGVPFNFLGGVDIDVPNNVLYFTDETLNSFQNFVEGDSTGRLIKYNITSREVTVLLQGLPRPVGPAISSDGKFIVYSSRGDRRIYKYSIKDCKAEVLLPELPGVPWKIKRAPKMPLLPLLPLSPETFWVSVNEFKPDGSVIPYAYKFDSCGTVHVIKNLSKEFPNTQVFGVQEYSQNVIGRKMYVGARYATYIGVYST